MFLRFFIFSVNGGELSDAPSRAGRWTGPALPSLSGLAYRQTVVIINCTLVRGLLLHSQPQRSYLKGARMLPAHCHSFRERGERERQRDRERELQAKDRTRRRGKAALACFHRISSAQHCVRHGHREVTAGATCWSQISCCCCCWRETQPTGGLQAGSCSHGQPAGLGLLWNQHQVFAEIVEQLWVVVRLVVDLVLSWPGCSSTGSLKS